MSNKFLIPDAALRQHVIALGKTRSGKSSKLRLIVERLLDQKKPVCIIDPKGDWWGLKSSADGKKPGYPIIIFGSEFARHADFRINAHSGAGVAELIATGNRPCLIDLKGMRVGERTKFFIDFASTYFAKAAGERFLVIDEVHHFAPQGKIPDPQIGEMLHWANRLVNEGSGMGITMLSASQRPQKVHKDYTSAHETLLACRVITKHDRDAIKDWIDACGDPVLGKEIINSLAGMPRTEAWVYSPETNFGPVRLAFPMFSTYDSFKPQSDKRRGRLKGWAAIDQSEVEAKLTKVVEEAKANDPKELRKQVAELSAKLRKLETAKSAPAPAAPKKEELDKIKQRAIAEAKKHFAPLLTALEAAMKFIVEIDAKDFFNAGGDAIDKKAIEKAITEATSHVTRLVERHLGGRDKQFEALRLEAQRLAARIKAAIEKSGEDITIQVAVQHNKPFTVVAPTSLANLPRAVPPPVPAGNGALTGAQQRIVDALAWLESIGDMTPSRSVAAFLADMSPRSSTFEKYVSMLKSGGLITYPAEGALGLTAEGRAQANAPSVALDHAAFMSKLAGKLTPAQMRLVGAAAAAYPNVLSRDELAAACVPPMSATSSTFEKYVSQLKSLGLIVYPDKGHVRADDRLFPERIAA